MFFTVNHKFGMTILVAPGPADALQEAKTILGDSAKPYDVHPATLQDVQWYASQVVSDKEKTKIWQL